MILLVNKWDLVEKDHNTAKMMESEIKKKTAPFTDYDIIFISAINKQRIHKVIETVDKVNRNRNRKVTTSELNEVMLELVRNNPPPSLKGKHVRIKYVTQLPGQVPSFAFFCKV